MSFDAYTTSGQGQNLFQQLPIQSTRDPVNGVDFNDPTGGPYQIGRRWFNKTNSNYWHYIGQGIWVLDASGTGAILGVDVPAGNSPIFADANGLINFTSNGGTVTISGSAGGLGAQEINFDVTGTVVTEKFAVDASTAPGTNPVNPTAGLVTLEGGTTYATGTRNNPIRTNSLAASSIDLEIQLAGNNAATASTNKFGVSQFDANQFNVTSGFVQLKGGTGPGVLTLTGDTGGAISPNGSGNISLLGGGSTTGIVSSGTSNEIDFSIYRWVAPAANNWTPVVAGSTTPGVGTYVKQHGVYSRIGNMIFFTFDLQWSAHTGTGNMLITGFPKQFSLANTNYPYIAFVENITLPANTVQVMFNGTNSTTQGSMVGIIDSSASSPVLINATGTICCYGFYFSDQA